MLKTNAPIKFNRTPTSFLEGSRTRDKPYRLDTKYGRIYLQFGKGIRTRGCISVTSTSRFLQTNDVEIASGTKWNTTIILLIFASKIFFLSFRSPPPSPSCFTILCLYILCRTISFAAVKNRFSPFETL